MAEITVREFANVVGVPVERLIAQLNEAGLVGKLAESPIAEQEKKIRADPAGTASSIIRKVFGSLVK